MFAYVIENRQSHLKKVTFYDLIFASETKKVDAQNSLTIRSSHKLFIATHKC